MAHGPLRYSECSRLGAPLPDVYPLVALGAIFNINGLGKRIGGIVLTHLALRGHPGLFGVEARVPRLYLIIKAFAVREVVHREELLLHWKLPFMLQTNGVGQFTAVSILYAISLLWARLIVIVIVRLHFDAGFSLWNSFHVKAPKVFDEVVLPRKAL